MAATVMTTPASLTLRCSSLSDGISLQLRDLGSDGGDDVPASQVPDIVDRGMP